VGLAYNLFLSALKNVSALLREPLTYYYDGLYSIHNADFMAEPAFKRAYELAKQTNHGHGPNLHIEWRTYVCCWAAKQATKLDGDFVECGVNAGMFSRAVADYVSFESQPRTFYLLDTFQGMPEDQFVPEENARKLSSRYVYGEMYESVRESFKAYDNVKLIRGRVPDSLTSVPSSKVAYLSIDMNAMMPEIAAAEYFWHKLVPGATIVLDDYGWREHVVQKKAFDAFAASHGTHILSLPTGQGLIVKA